MEKIETIRAACIKANPAGEYFIYACEGCCTIYSEYVNGCPRCWDASLTREENLKKFTVRNVTRRERPIHLTDVLMPLSRKLGAQRPTINYTVSHVIFNGGAPWGPRWILTKDDLEQQLPETINFLYDLLK